MKKYRYVPGVVLLVLALISMSTEGVPEWLSMALCLVAVAAMVYASRGMASYAKAVKKINSSTAEGKAEGVALMKKALKAGLSDSSAVVAGAVLLQNDDPEMAKDVLERLSSSTDRKVSSPAMTSLSMYYWTKKDYQKAIELCEKAKANGYSTRNLQINLLTYYIAAGKTREFDELLHEMGTSGAASPAIVDFHAINEMLHGDWKQAGAFLEALCLEAKPKFPDPYVHFAQVYLHYGDLGDARKLLEEALHAEYARFSVYTKEGVSEMLRALSDSYECVPFTEAANRDNKAILKIVNGGLPRWEAAAEPFTGDAIPGYPAMPQFKLEIRNAEVELDDRDVDTELNEDDERWLERHQP